MEEGNMGEYLKIGEYIIYTNNIIKCPFQLYVKNTLINKSEYMSIYKLISILKLKRLDVIQLYDYINDLNIILFKSSRV